MPYFLMCVLGLMIALVAIITIAWAFGLVGIFEIDEATATAFQYLGGFRYLGIQYAGRHLKNDYFIEDGAGPQSIGRCWCIWQIGGWVIYVAAWGLVKPTKYTDQNDADGFGEDHSVFLNQIQRSFTLEKAETQPGEVIPLDIDAVFKMMVVNPYLFLFVAPKDVVAQVTKIVEAMVRAWVVAHTANEVQLSKSNGVELWAEILASGSSKQAVGELRNKWGIEVVPDSLSIMDVGLQPEDQTAFEAKKRQSLEALGVAQELVGAMLSNSAVINGLPDADAARAKLQETEDGKKLLDDMLAKANQLVIERKLSQAGGFQRINITGLGDAGGLLAAAATILKSHDGVHSSKTGGSGSVSELPPPLPGSPKR